MLHGIHCRPHHYHADDFYYLAGKGRRCSNTWGSRCSEEFWNQSARQSSPENQEICSRLRCIQGKDIVLEKMVELIGQSLTPFEGRWRSDIVYNECTLWINVKNIFCFPQKMSLMNHSAWQVYVVMWKKRSLEITRSRYPPAMNSSVNGVLAFTQFWFQCPMLARQKTSFNKSNKPM